jgi:hypothetical protein
MHSLTCVKNYLDEHRILRRQAAGEFRRHVEVIDEIVFLVERIAKHMTAMCEPHVKARHGRLANSVRGWQMRFVMAASVCVGLWLSSCSVSLAAEEYCSLNVKVIDASGREVLPGERIAVEERTGRNIERKYVQGGVRFCDLGITPVTLTVGLPGCNQVVVRDVPLTFGEMVTSLVVADSEACSKAYPHAPIFGCSFLFRILGPSGNAVAAFIESPSFKKVLQSDSAGRVMLHGEWNQEVQGTIRAAGYRPQDVLLDCTPENIRVERYITMSPE